MAVRIALFLCDTPIPPVVEESGDYAQIFSDFIRKSTPNDAVSFVMDPYDVRNKMEYPEDVDKYDAIMLTGSAASAYENLEWINKLVSYMASVIEAKPQIKILGICFGHQIVARALGKDCVPNGGRWEVGITPMELTETGRKILGADQLNLQQMHRDHVPEVPSGCDLLASTQMTPNHGFIRYEPSSPKASLADIQIFCVQGHPEFTESIVEKIVELRSSTGVIDRPTAALSRERAKWRNDGVSVVGRAIWQILLSAQSRAA
ncbi:hypothetical protein PHLGIDRAFT_129743 [Phlebiopsis gigantea 11061_1 CR5-6]|uniref:Glutamine amidotransferase domain-containing protein n=1 Tax=Phlebiopsis gigantea (strain 11061_1 CR5-6) TaxID=745531 RepID=A0A0C3NH17_PHLG1|nr:hypothetical protein PHLGIDRAFT_129743 [Phlebiopsis gigantea 11061_1 CR5-6]